jgi:5'-3' exonuclease
MVAAMTNHLLLIDASGFAHRAFYANAAMYRADGLPIWAIVGFMGMVWSLRQRAQADSPTHGACVFDAPGKNFRHHLFPDYKANRPKARRAELIPQLPYMRHAATAMGLPPVEKSGWEADDVIATLATVAARRGWRTTIVSSDKDFCQLVRDGVIEIIEPLNRARVLTAGVKARFGVPPDLVPDVQALWGDDVDGIPGVDGIGGKGAGALIRQFGGLENLIDAANRSGMRVGTPAVRKAIRTAAAAKPPHDVRTFKKLATLDVNVPGLPDLDDLVLHKPEPDHLKEMLKVLGEGRRFNDMFGGNPDVTIRLPHVPASLAWWHGVPKPSFPAGTGTRNFEPAPLKEIPRDPQDGYFKTRLIRGGPWVPARIWRDQEKDFISGIPTGFDVVKCEIDGKPRNPLREWMSIARMPISKEDFDHRVALGGWAKNHDKASSEANPGKVIDWNKEPL